MSKPTYILQKDLPDYNAGEEFEFDGLYYTAKTKCADGVKGSWSPLYVENNPTWFLPKQEKQTQERIEVIALNKGREFDEPPGKEYCYTFRTNKLVDFNKFPDIEKAIEQVINNDEPPVFNIDDLDDIFTIRRKEVDVPFPQKTYTEQQLLERLEKAFNSARETQSKETILGVFSDYKHKTFSDFKNSQTK